MAKVTRSGEMHSWAEALWVEMVAQPTFSASATSCWSPAPPAQALHHLRHPLLDYHCSSISPPHRHPTVLPQDFHILQVLTCLLITTGADVKPRNVWRPRPSLPDRVTSNNTDRSINVNDPGLITLVNKLQDVFSTVGVSSPCATILSSCADSYRSKTP